MTEKCHQLPPTGATQSPTTIWISHSHPADLKRSLPLWRHRSSANSCRGREKLAGHVSTNGLCSPVCIYQNTLSVIEQYLRKFFNLPARKIVHFWYTFPIFATWSCHTWMWTIVHIGTAKCLRQHRNWPSINSNPLDAANKRCPDFYFRWNNSKIWHTAQI